jgi:uncharacterized protein (DUF1800 family)
MTLLQRAALVGLLLAPATLAGHASPRADFGPPQRADDAGALAPALPWNRRAVEHIYNRAGFGAREDAIRRALRRGPEAVVDELLNGGRATPPPQYSQGTLQDLKRGDELPRAQKRRVKAELSQADHAQLAGYAGWWLERMVRHDDPLRDRMTLLWHGLFATESRNIKRSYDMIEQHQLLRNNALESYADLLRGIVEDPAMLLYLDNNKNHKGSPNENLARELLELFSLGEGNYSELDVREVARALTGNSRDRLGNYVFNADEHDGGRKTILGETGRYDAGGVIEILLRQVACARHVAGRIITYLEGTPPDELRLVEYAAYLQRKQFQMKPFLRKLLLDPRFYREQVVGTRVASPVDYLVGSTRRLAIDVGPEFLFVATGELGQELFDPPSVKGWDEGEAWIDTGSLLARGNTVGLLLGTVDLEASFQVMASVSPGADAAPSSGKRGPSRGEADAEETMDEDSIGEETMEESMMGEVAMGEVAAREPKDRLPGEIANVVKSLGDGYVPRLDLSRVFQKHAIVGDDRIIGAMLENLLAIEPPADTHARLVRRLLWEREAAQLSEEGFLSDPDLAESILRRIAHLILSLPEAQLG